MTELSFPLAHVTKERAREIALEALQLRFRYHGTGTPIQGRKIWYRYLSSETGIPVKELESFVEDLTSSNRSQGPVPLGPSLLRFEGIKLEADKKARYQEIAFKIICTNMQICGPNPEQAIDWLIKAKIKASRPEIVSFVIEHVMAYHIKRLTGATIVAVVLD